MVHSAGKIRKIPISNSAGATNPSARTRPSPATSAAGARLATGASSSAVPAPGSTTGHLVLADRLHQRLLVSGGRVVRALTAEHVRGCLLERGGDLRVVRETGPEAGERQHLGGDEVQHR